MILHAFWDVDSYVMALWAERPADGWLSPSGARRNPWHHGAFRYEDFSEDLPEALDVYEDDHTAILPTCDGKPLHSTDDVPESSILKPYRLHTANSIADCIFEFLLTNDDIDAALQPFTIGQSLRYWDRLLSFAKQMVDRNCYAPGIAELEGRVYPTWQIVFTPDEEAYWHQILNAMPPVCMSNYQMRDMLDAPLTAKRIALSFLDAAIDHLVRNRVLRQNTRRMSYKRSTAAAARQWLNNLKSGRLAALEGSDRELEVFATDVRSWNQYMRLPNLNTPFRLVFLLAAPENEDDPWEVHFALQAARDPSVLLRAEQIWFQDKGTAPTSSVIRAREIMLAGLGKSLDVFPQIGETLHSDTPTHCELDKFEAIEFMTRTAPLLRRRGLQVILPNWWEDPQDSLTLTLHITPAEEDALNEILGEGSGPIDRQPNLGIDQLVQYKWDVALGERKLSEDEFKALSQTKEPLVHRYGKWYRLDGELLRKSVSMLEQRQKEGNTSLDKAMKLGLEMEKAGLVPVIHYEAEGDPTELLRRLNPAHQFELLEEPDGLKGSLRPYQRKGFSWLDFVRRIGCGACLADDMGLGKTIQMITAILRQLRENPEDKNPSLIICPMSVVGNWVKEINRFAPELEVMVHHGSDRDSHQIFEDNANHHDVVITTYALAVRDQTCLLRCYWRNIILDEAQNIKNPNTKQALAIRSLRGGSRFCLTGTPIENRLTELWSIMEFLNPGYLGKLTSFRANFSVPIERDKDSSRADVLQKIIRPFVLRRLKSDSDIIRDLPEKQEMKVYCNLTPEQASLYQAIVDDMLSTIDSKQGISRRGLVLSTLMKLKQVTNHPAHFLRDMKTLKSERSGKLQRLEEMLEVILEEKDRALVFTQFSEFGSLLQQKLQTKFGIEALYLHGGTPKTKREEMVARFQARKGPPIFILSLKAGGVGLNLTAACHVFHFDRWWNPAVEDQATDRAFRIGQTRNVQVHKFVCVGTVEDKIDHMLDEKKRLADFIVSPGEDMLTELSTDELRNIFSLTRDAVIEA